MAIRHGTGCARPLHHVSKPDQRVQPQGGKGMAPEGGSTAHLGRHPSCVVSSHLAEMGRPDNIFRPQTPTWAHSRGRARSQQGLWWPKAQVPDRCECWLQNLILRQGALAKGKCGQEAAAPEVDRDVPGTDCSTSLREVCSFSQYLEPFAS